MSDPSFVECWYCGACEVDVVTDECRQCGRRNRLIQSPVGCAVISVAFIAILAAIWALS